ncbi:MAG: tetratricopeptide repeat protein [Planctomycetes bacterium]|nr:tetratricopeptide repeat protein [Planctomycetota bacterium]NUQ33410.1 tetratricopeptide repeat protein [Planctomycetaceae bacterium]
MKTQPETQTFEFTGPEGCIERVRDYVSERNILGALAAIEHGKKHFSGMMELPEAQLLAGKIARWRERFKEARQWFRRAAQHKPFHTESMYEIGRVWLEAGRTELAVDAFLDVVEDEHALIPYRTHAWAGLCVCFAGLERMKSAEEAIRKAASFGLISAQLLADEARYLTIGGASEEAQAQLARALQIDTSCVDAFELLANLFHIGGRSQEAKEILAYGIENSPHSLKLMALMAEVHSSIGEYRESAAFHRRCLEISPAGANADSTRLSFARCFYGAGRTKNAIAELEALLQRHPRSTHRREARERLKALSSDARNKHTIANFPRKLQKRNYCAPNTLANVLAYFGSEQTQDRIAEEVFTEGTRWNDLVTFLGRIKGFRTFAFLSDLGQVKEILNNDIPVVVGEYSGVDGHCIALIGYDDQMGVVIAQDPLFHDPIEITYSEFKRSWAFTDNLVVITVPERQGGMLDLVEKEGQELVQNWLEALKHREEGHFDDAVNALEELLKREPEYSSARRTLIEIAIMLRDFDRAKELIDEALELEEHSYWSLRYAGDVAMIQKDYAGALDFYARAVRLFPDDPTLHYLRGEIAFSAGDRKRGRAELMHALDDRPGDIRPRLRLAKDYLDSGDLRRAAYHAKAALELAPSNPVAENILKQAGKTATAKL